MTTAEVSMIDKSEYIARRSNVNRETRGSLYWSETTLYRHSNGHLFVVTTGAQAMQTHGPELIDYDSALEFVVNECTEHGSDYRYTRDEAVRLLAGEDVKASL